MFTKKGILSHSSIGRQFCSHCETGSVRKSERADKQVGMKDRPLRFTCSHTQTRSHTPKHSRTHTAAVEQQQLADWSAKIALWRTACAVDAILKGGNRRKSELLPRNSFFLE